MTLPFEAPDDWSEEEALARGMTFCAVCECWGTVPGSTRCQDCTDDDEDVPEVAVLRGNQA